MNSRVYKALSVLSGLLIIVACQDGKSGYSYPSFNETITQDFSVFGDEVSVGYPVLMLKRDSVLFVFGYSFENGTHLHMYDSFSGRKISDAIFGGRGPGDVMRIENAYFREDTLAIWDNITNSISYFNSIKLRDGNTDAFISSTAVDYGPFTVFNYPCNNGHDIVIRNLSPEQEQGTVNRIEITGYQGASYSEYPLEDRQILWKAYQQPKVTVSPDMHKLAIAPSYCMILELFSIENLKITNTDTKRYIEPLFTLDNGNINELSGFSYGVQSIISTDDWIAAAMAENGISAQMSRDKGLPFFPILAVFDWKGEGLLSVKTSQDIQCLTYDPTDNVMYAIIKDAEGTFHLAKLHLPRLN